MAAYVKPFQAMFSSLWWLLLLLARLWRVSLRFRESVDISICSFALHIVWCCVLLVRLVYFMQKFFYPSNLFSHYDHNRYILLECYDQHKASLRRSRKETGGVWAFGRCSSPHVGENLVIHSSVYNNISRVEPFLSSLWFLVLWCDACTVCYDARGGLCVCYCPPLGGLSTECQSLLSNHVLSLNASKTQIRAFYHLQSWGTAALLKCGRFQLKVTDQPLNLDSQSSAKGKRTVSIFETLTPKKMPLLKLQQ